MSNGISSTGGTGGTGTSGGPGPTGGVQNPLTLLVPMTQAGVQTLAPQLQKLQDQIDEGLTQIGIVHFARLLFLPNTTTIAVITTYDGEFNDYIQSFADNPTVATVFDLFLGFIDDTNTPPNVPKASQCIPVQENAAAFTQFLNYYDYTSVQRRGTFAWYTAYPTLTVNEIIQDAQTVAALKAAPAQQS